MTLASPLPVPLMLALPVSGQVVDIGAEREADRRLYRVGALVERLGHHVADVVDDVGIVAEAAGHGVGPDATVEDVVAGVAGNDVGVAVAGAVDVGAAGEGQVLNIGTERVGDRRLYRIGAFVERLGHHVAGVIDHVSVVADATHHRVDACAAVERVVTAVAGDDVGIAVAGAVDVGAAGQGQVVDIGAEREADRRLHRVGAFVERLGHHVADVVDHVGVVAGAADQRVRASAAVERVVAVAAEHDVHAAGAGDLVGDRRAVEHRSQRHAIVGKQRMGGIDGRKRNIVHSGEVRQVDDAGCQRRGGGRVEVW